MPLLSLDIQALKQQFLKLKATESKIIRLEIPIDKVNGLAWLGRQSIKTQYFWEDRDKNFWMAGLGDCVVFQGELTAPLDYMRKIVKKIASIGQTSPRFYGGARFYEQHDAPSEWDKFQAYRFVLPQFECVYQDDEYYFVMNIQGDASTLDAKFEDLLALVKTLEFESAGDEITKIGVKEKALSPMPDEWNKMVHAALEEIKHSKLQKLVLARRVSYSLTQPLPATECLGLMPTQSCFQFLFQPNKERAFWGASPELLFKQCDDQLEVDAIAGTAKRGESAVDDLSFETQLRASIKDQAEHQLVIRGISQRFDENQIPYEVLDQQLLKLSHVQHLYTPIYAQLSNVALTEIMELLHPTPAVGGYPAKQAIDKMRALEPFDRGCYAGPVGWVGDAEACFAVAIRSGLMQDKNVHLYTGAGIVIGSDADKEWDELDAKLGLLGQILDEAAK